MEEWKPWLILKIRSSQKFINFEFPWEMHADTHTHTDTRRHIHKQLHTSGRACVQL